MEKELTRETVDPRYTWDLTRIYASDEAWEEAFASVKAQAEAFAKRAGTLSHGREAVLDALTAMMRMDETFFALHAYAMMKNNEDSTNAKYQAMSDRAGTLAGVVAAACSFMEPELLALEEGEIRPLSLRRAAHEGAHADGQRGKADGHGERRLQRGGDRL